jgi:hypothetical protein
VVVRRGRDEMKLFSSIRPIIHFLVKLSIHPSRHPSMDGIIY